MRPQTAKCHDPPTCVASRHNLGPPASSRRPRRTTTSRRIGSSPPSPSRPPPLSRRLISTAVEPPWPSAARLPSPSHRLGFGRESPPPESRLHRRRRLLSPEPALYCNYHFETSCQAPPHSVNRTRRFKSSTRLRFAKASCRTRSPLHRRTNPPCCAARRGGEVLLQPPHALRHLSAALPLICHLRIAGSPHWLAPLIGRLWLPRRHLHSGRMLP